MITLGRSVCRDLPRAVSHEWLVTNGIGGYASGTVPGVNTRRYHGLLIASLEPPVGRYQLVANCDEDVEMDGVTYYLGANEYQEDRIHPGGFVHLESFTLEKGIPTFLYRVGPAFLRKMIWMEYGRNTTYVRYQLVDSPYPLNLILRPFVNYRDHHALTKGSIDKPFSVHPLPIGGGCSIRARPDARQFYMLSSPRATFTASGVWYWKFAYRIERERGEPASEDLYQPGVFRATLQPSTAMTLICTSEQPAAVDRDADAALARAHTRQERLLRRAGILIADDTQDAALPESQTSQQAFRSQLVQAADQFIVTRQIESVRATGEPTVRPAPEPAVYTKSPTEPRTEAYLPLPSPARQQRSGDSDAEEALDDGPRTVIAGYPWFNDWGRDTMIALPGLTLATGRPNAAASILRTFAYYIDQGMLPNLFPDGGATPEYNTVDATLWYFHAIEEYCKSTDDYGLAYELWSQLEDIVRWHLRGTRYGIKVDPEDGLLAAGEPGAQLTWMDAKVGDEVFTPRHGKPVEIQALWYHALRIMQRIAKRRVYEEIVAVEVDSEPLDYAALADRVRESFRARFWYEDGGYFYDVVDTPTEAGDSSLRPNQLFALSLEADLVEVAPARRALETMRRTLLTPVGLRTLAPSDPRYRSIYVGAYKTRDAMYHQGPVWPWLIGAYIDAARRWEGLDQDGVLELLAPLQRHLADACAGSISEIFDSDAPYTPRACFAQAWSVAEVLRVLDPRQ